MHWIQCIVCKFHLTVSTGFIYPAETDRAFVTSIKSPFLSLSSDCQWVSVPQTTLRNSYTVSLNNLGPVLEYNRHPPERENMESRDCTQL